MIDLLKICLKEMEIELLIQRLKTYLKPTSIHYNRVMLQSQRYISVQKKLTNGFIKNEDNTIELTKITAALHELIDELDENDFLCNETSKLISKNNIQEAIEFIQGRLNTSNYKGSSFFKKFCTFKYKNGIGIFSYELHVDNKIRLVEEKVPFKDIKNLEIRQTLSIFEIFFYTRNRKQSISRDFKDLKRIATNPTVFMVEPIEDLQDKAIYFTLELDNKENAEKLAKAFQFLMKANGAKEEMF